ncbi:MAG: hypothetical protein ABJL99_21075 [Aliishimia sp.]
MSFSDIVLWPGTKVCEHMGIDPTSDAGLVRWMINTLVYLFVCLTLVWVVVV